VSVELFANNAQTTVTSGGTTAPASGTQETWTVASSATFPAASNTTTPTTYFFVFDPAAQTEVIQVTNVSGTTWTVVRGASVNGISTTPVAHTAGFTVYQDISAQTLMNFKQAIGAATTAVTVAGTTNETVLATQTPPANIITPGVSFSVIAFGPYGKQQSVALPTLQFALYWGGSGSVGGTYTIGTGVQLCKLTTGTNAPPLLTVTASGQTFDLNGDVTLIDATHAVANLNLWYNNAASLATVAVNALTSSAASTAVPSGGSLFLTAKWSVSNAANTLTALAPLIYRAA
jgi:hypothetical protein